MFRAIQITQSFEGLCMLLPSVFQEGLESIVL